MKMDYTKGEWRESHGDIYCNEEKIASSESLGLLGLSRITEAKANAQLIASAPDLYEAAKQVSRESGPDMSPSLGAIDDLREALAKAEGKNE